MCIHPGWPILRGWPLIEESWRRIFAGPGRNQFIVTNDVVASVGDVAWVTLDENLVDQLRHRHRRRDQHVRAHAPTAGGSSSTTARRSATPDAVTPLSVAAGVTA